MSDADWFSPYAHPRALRHEGEVRGYHLTEQIGTSGRMCYLARLELRGALPRLALRPRGLATTTQGALGDNAFGPVLETGEPDLDRYFVVRSEGYELPAALFGRHPAHEPLVGRVHELRRQLQSIELLPGDSHGSLLVDVELGPGNAGIHGAMELAKALLARADLLVEEGRRFRSAWQVLTGGSGPLEPSPEKLEELASFIAQTTDWVTGHVARVKDTIEGRLVLAEAGAELDGVVYLAWRDEHMRGLDIELQAALPEVRAPELRLSQRRGLVGFLKGLTELEIGDEALDEAFLIEGAPAARPLLLDGREPLLALARYGAEVRFTGAALSVTAREVPFEPLPLRAVIESGLLLWRRAARFRAGLREGPVDPA